MRCLVDRVVELMVSAEPVTQFPGARPGGQRRDGVDLRGGGFLCGERGREGI
jgi:hypothetical protein